MRWAGAVVLAILLSRDAAASGVITFGPPHHARRSRAVLDHRLRAVIDAALAGGAPRTTDAAIAFTLAVAGRSLHFGLGHRTRLAFTTAEREGNCIEYAHLFAAVFERAARRGGVDAAAWVIHSDDARVLGGRLPVRGLHDHDWVLIQDRSTGARWFVDPTLADAGLGWDIRGNVRGEVTAR